MNKDTVQMLGRLQAAGISTEDALTLRRIAMTLHRWHELECGIDGGCIEYDEIPHEPAKAYWLNSHTMTRSRIPNREEGARKRLAAIMAKYPDMWAYVQTDPRGASLYVGKYNPATKNSDPHLFYTNGIAVYK